MYVLYYTYVHILTCELNSDNYLGKSSNVQNFKKPPPAIIISR